MSWETLKNAVAQVKASGDGSVTGTAFFIGGKHLLTALHVVAETEKDKPVVFAKQIKLKFPGGHETDANVVEEFWDRSDDWAVLECVTAPPGVQPIARKDTPAQDTEWKSFGYPQIKVDGKTVVGKVRDPSATFESMPAMELFCEEAAAGQGARLHGLSGAPCVVDGGAAGVLRATLIEEVIDGKRQRILFTQAGTAYACPAKAVVDFQVNTGKAILTGTWSPPEIVQKEFLVFLSSSDGKDKQHKKLQPVAAKAQQKLGKLISAPFTVSADSVLENRTTFLECVAALCRAKVVVFDATDFEPAIMLLAGIRSVVRRGLTILSVGGDYALGGALDVPFNVTDTNVVAHSSNQEIKEPDPVDLLASRIRRGLHELTVSSYIDNPVYETIRALPADRRGLIPKQDGVLVLCPFERTYTADIWERRLSKGLKYQWDLLRDNEPSKPYDLGVSRSFELNSPRLVTQALYEHIRRAQACVVDLTQWSGSVLFELGVRLASTREGTSCLISKGWQPKRPEYLKQCSRIMKLFVHETDGIYDPDTDWDQEEVYGKAYGPNAVLPSSGLGDGSVHRTIDGALDVANEPASRPAFRELIDSAGQFGKLQGNSKPVGLYPGNAILTAQEEVAEFERLFAAWLHIYFRYLIPKLQIDENLRKAMEHISVTLVERHEDRIAKLRSGCPEELKNVLDALVEAFNNSN